MIENNPVVTTRFTFPEDRTTFVYGPPGTPIRTPPRTGLKIYLDEECTQPANIQSTLGAEVPYSTIYTQDDSLLPQFLGPPGFVPKVWVRIVGGSSQAYPLMAEYSDQLAQLPFLLSGNGPPPFEVGAVGSFYIDRDESPDPNHVPDVRVYGPRTVEGWPETGTRLRGPKGEPGEKSVWLQPNPALVWEITHSLTGQPSVSIVDSAGFVCHGDIRYSQNDPQKVFVEFGAPESGRAILT